MTSNKNNITTIIAIILIVVFVLVAVLGTVIGIIIYKHVPKPPATVITYEAATDEVTDEAMDSAIKMLHIRLANLGYTEATVARQGEKRIRIEIPGVSNDEALEKLGTPGKLTFRDSAGNVLMEGSSEYVKDASAQYDANELGNFVVLEFTQKGKEAFASATAAVYGTADPRLYIYLDETVQSAPTVQEVINNDTCQITGDFTPEQAAWLANIIKEGQMPFSLEQKSASSISASLGEKALSTSMLACGIGILLVMLFMLIFYRIPGLIADLALVAYTSIMLLVLCEFETFTNTVINLTLPGIAGIVLGVGMAVDANVIIFERIKEELKAGKTVGASTEAGFKRAFTAILDGNVTTFIVAVILFIFGTGTIQGFAVTLGLGIVISMFTAVVVTRFLLKSLIGLNIRNPKLYGASLRGGKQDA